MFEAGDGFRGGGFGEANEFMQADTEGFHEAVGFDGGLRELLLAANSVLFRRHRCEAVNGGREAREIKN